MIVLDENILDGQRRLLEAHRRPVRQIGHDLFEKGIQDEQIVVRLLGLRRASFFTRDAGFFRRDLCHPRYCLVHVDCNQYETAEFIRRFLRHPSFDTLAKRMGKVVRVGRSGISAWTLNRRSESKQQWR